MSTTITRTTIDATITPVQVTTQLAGIGPQGPPGPPGPGYIWQEVITASAQMQNGYAYIANNSSRVTLTLPSTAAVGDSLAVVGKGAGGWLIAQNTGQAIHFGTQSTAAGIGSLASQAPFDCVEIVCITANTDFLVRSAQGNITVT